MIQETGLLRAMVARLAAVIDATIWAWLLLPESEAARAPSPESVRKLARGLRTYGPKLHGLADALEGLARAKGEGFGRLADAF